MMHSLIGSRRSRKPHIPAVQCKLPLDRLTIPHSRSQKLINRGHKVIVITHAFKGRKGVRYLTNGLKVYYVPFWTVYRETTFPTVFSFFPIFRNIVIREQIEIVHGHASLSNLCNEAILHARTMGLYTVFTDHSLFGFADAGSILTNKLLKFTLSDVDHVICVSHTWYVAKLLAETSTKHLQ
jgi:phosphatidylinositol glycan class A protein